MGEFGDDPKKHRNCREHNSNEQHDCGWQGLTGAAAVAGGVVADAEADAGAGAGARLVLILLLMLLPLALAVAGSVTAAIGVGVGLACAVAVAIAIASAVAVAVAVVVAGAGAVAIAVSVENRFGSSKRCTKSEGSKSKSFVLGGEGEDVFIQAPALVSRALDRNYPPGGFKQRKRALFT